VTWSWEAFRALPARGWTVDISCVTEWTKIDMRWRGVSFDTLLGRGTRPVPELWRARPNRLRGLVQPAPLFRLPHPQERVIGVRIGHSSRNASAARWCSPFARKA